MSNPPTRRPRRAVTTATATRKAATDPASVSVRMYRALDPAQPYKGLLGDCFLIRLVAGDKASHILIDCGLLLGSKDQEKRAKKIAEDIARTCKGSLDLLVVTHEHWDHISGFAQASEIFFDQAKLRIENLWMAWTEDLADPDAKALRAKFDAAGPQLAAIAQRLANEPIPGLDAGPVPDDPEDAKTRRVRRVLNGLDGFLGASTVNGKLSGREIFEKLKTQSIQPPKYLAPVQKDRVTTKGNVVQTPGAVTTRAFVLGPPRDTKRLFKDKPSNNPDKQETYLETPTMGDALIKFAAGADVFALEESPFAPQYCRRELTKITEAITKNEPPGDADNQWLLERYFATDIPAADEQRRKMVDRRRIDGDWLGAAGALALKLDSDTNNTSLVLAFELPDNTVMLFAADAQVGNWLSWHDQKYVDDQNREHSAQSILERVRFYKVGHHGSHNATLDKQGLAMMTRDDLVAVIPTDEELGSKQGGGWQMPNPRVNTALMARTKGRIIRNDRHYDEASRKRDKDLKNVEESFFDRINETDMYVEYIVF